MWKNYKSAPKDGRFFLAYCDESDMEENEDGDFNSFHGLCILRYKDEHDNFYSDTCDGYITFTHWMDLPAGASEKP